MEELLSIPDNGFDRWLIAGEVRERAMPTRNRFHSRIMTATSTELELWNREQPPLRGEVLTGDAGVRLHRDPDTVFAIDVVYVSAELLAKQTTSTMIDGVPTLAVEILSPSDVQEDIEEKIDALLHAGVPLVWIINPHRGTVVVHRPDAEPELFNLRQELLGEPHLPGLRLPVQRLFELGAIYG